VNVCSMRRSRAARAGASAAIRAAGDPSASFAIFRSPVGGLRPHAFFGDRQRAGPPRIRLT
jgi:hypothetical protein